MNTAKAIWRYSLEFKCPPYRGNRHASSQHFHPDASFNSWKPGMVPRFIMLILCGSRILANLRVMLSRLSPLLELPPRNDSDSQREFNKQSTKGICKINYSVASTIPCSLIPKEASPSGRQGESTTLQMRVVPRPFFNRNLRSEPSRESTEWCWHVP